MASVEQEVLKELEIDYKLRNRINDEVIRFVNTHYHGVVNRQVWNNESGNLTEKILGYVADAQKELIQSRQKVEDVR